MTSHGEAAETAEGLARVLLDADVLPDDVEDLVRDDAEFLELALARQAIGDAERCESAVGADRHGDLQEAQYDVDVLASERLGELLEANGIDVVDVAGACPVVGRRSS